MYLVSDFYQILKCGTARAIEAEMMFLSRSERMVADESQIFTLNNEVIENEGKSFFSSLNQDINGNLRVK